VCFDWAVILYDCILVLINEPYPKLLDFPETSRIFLGVILHARRSRTFVNNLASSPKSNSHSKRGETKTTYFVAGVREFTERHFAFEHVFNCLCLEMDAVQPSKTRCDQFYAQPFSPKKHLDWTFAHDWSTLYSIWTSNVI